MTVEQAINLTYLDVNGLQLSWASNTTLGVTTGRSRDSSNTMDIVLSAPIVINAATTGANGLDTGSLAATTWYNVFVVGDSLANKAPATVISTSSTPLLPKGYSSYRHIGWAKTDGSSHFLKFYQSGINSTRRYQWDVPIAILSGGTSTTFAAIDASVGAPKQAMPIFLNIAYTPTAAASTASIRPTGSSAAALSCPVELKSNVDDVAVKESSVQVLPQLSAGNASLDYIVTSGDALTLTVSGFEDYL